MHSSKRDTINVDALISNLANTGLDFTTWTDSDEDDVGGPAPPPIAARTASATPASSLAAGTGGVVIGGTGVEAGGLLPLPERLKKKSERKGMEDLVWGPDYSYTPDNKMPTVTDASVFGLALLKKESKSKWKEMWFTVAENYFVAFKKRGDWSFKHAWHLSEISFTPVSHLDLAYALSLNTPGGAFHFASASQAALDVWVEWLVPYY